MNAYAARGWPENIPEFINGEYSRPDFAVFDMSRSAALKDIIIKKATGRQAQHEITCFHNYKGLGLQFAAIGSIVYAEARKRQLGATIEDRYFSQSVHP